MRDIDQKLKALDLEFLPGVPVHLTDAMVEQIKQAFKDAAWVQVPPEVEETWRTYIQYGWLHDR